MTRKRDALPLSGLHPIGTAATLRGHAAVRSIWDAQCVGTGAMGPRLTSLVILKKPPLWDGFFNMVGLTRFELATP